MHIGNPSYDTIDVGQCTQPTSMHHGPDRPGPGSYAWTTPGAYYDDQSQNDILLLVQEDKRFGEEKISDAEAQLIAEAIAERTSSTYDY
jgi:hypothetical protein